MKRLSILLVAVLLLTSVAFTSAFADDAVTGNAPLKGQLPLLITNAGQGPEGKEVRLLVSQAGALTSAQYMYDAEPGHANSAISPNMNTALRNYKTLFVVIGSSAKGLGASGITIDDEIRRLNAMMTEAKRLNMQIIAIHIGGREARSSSATNANERSINAIAPHANGFIVLKDGNYDGRFTTLARNVNAPLTIIDTKFDLMSVIQTMYK